MFKHVKQRWHELITAPPGKRFQQYYVRRHLTARSRFRKLLVTTAGMGIFAVGILFLATPGPGLVLLAVGAAMMAEESYLAARAFDRIEVLVRRLADQALHAWRHSPLWRGMVILLTVATAGVAGWVVYRVILKHGFIV